MFEEYKGKRVLVTGHTGFKGSWLSLWLHKCGAEVMGYSLPPSTTPNHYQYIKHKFTNDNGSIFSYDVKGDVLDLSMLEMTIEEFKPEIVFHLAAQPIVRLSYEQPLLTYQTNVIGTMNVLEACKRVGGVKAIVVITTDKCYENNEWVWGYRETDRLGGHDPYSSSKACVEIMVDSFRSSYFNLNKYEEHGTLLATTRAGNVIGGGDWASDRLIPDIIRATVNGEKVQIRNPLSTRPFQHVLDPLRGYMMLASRLYNGEKEFSGAWNFSSDEAATVITLLDKMKAMWNDIDYEIVDNSHMPHEARYLKLDSSKAKDLLGWIPMWNINDAINYTSYWYDAYYNENKIISSSDIKDYETDCKIEFGQE